MFNLPLTCESHITIERPTTEVFEKVANFETWGEWSPWLCTEPDCPVNISEPANQIGHKQAWSGKIIGSGEMVLVHIDQGHRLEYELTFLKPWKSKSTVCFTFHEGPEGTTVTWNMDGSIPVFLFFMKKMMTALIKSDYDRGLKMLKEWMETGKVETQIKQLGQVQQEEIHYIGIRSHCTMQEIEIRMDQDFDQLMKAIDDQKVPKPTMMFSLYEKMDIAKQHTTYIAALGYDSTPAIEDANSWVRGNLPAHSALQTDHIGSYAHLGNAWSAAIGVQRAEGKKINKSIPMYEVYLNSPKEVESKNIHTQIYIPIKK